MSTVPETITATVMKENPKTKVGITFVKKGGNLIVKSVIEGGLFSKTPIQPGMELVSVNGMTVAGMPSKTAADMIRGIGEGEVTIIAKVKPPPAPPTSSSVTKDSITGTIVKEDKSTKAGIAFVKHGDDLVVKKIIPNGLFSKTNIQPGMKVLSVNGTTVTPSMAVTDARDIIRNAEPGTVSVTVQDFSVPTMTGTVTKEEKTSKVGITFVKVGDDILLVKKIIDGGLFAKQTKIMAGMEIISVCGTSVIGFSVKDAIDLLKNADAGDVSVVVKTLPPTITGTVIKAAKDSKVGITFSKKDDTKLVVKNVVDGGLFATSTSIQPDMEIISVCGTSVTGMSVTEAIDLIRVADAGEVSVVVLKGGEVQEEEVKEEEEPVPVPASVPVPAVPEKEEEPTKTEEEEPEAPSPPAEEPAEEEPPTKAEEEPEPEPDIVVEAPPKEEPAPEKEEEEPEPEPKDEEVPETEPESKKEEEEPPIEEVAAAASSPPEQQAPTEDGLIVGNGFKETKDAKLGIIFARSRVGGPLLINTIKDDGLFANTGLKAGYQVVSVNGQSMDGMTPKNAVWLLRNATGPVSVVAKEAASLVVTGTVTKVTEATKVGIVFTQSKSGEPLFIKSLTKDGLFSKTPLTRGLQVLEVAGQTISPGTAPKDAASLLRSAGPGPVSVVAKVPEPRPQEADTVTGTVNKPSKTSKVGIAFAQEVGGKGPIVIKSITEGGLFASTDLKVGMELVSVCGKGVGSTKEAVQDLRNSEGTVSVTAKPPSKAAELVAKKAATHPTISGTVMKESQTTKLGITFGMANGAMIISNIIPGGRFAKTPLKIGLQVVSVNGQHVSRMTTKQAVDILRNAGPGEVTVRGRISGSPATAVASRSIVPATSSAPTGAASTSVVTGTVTKASKDSKLGISFAQKGNGTGPMVIKSLPVGGLFAKTDLKPGLEVLFVNGVDVTSKTTREAADLLRNAPAGEVSIKARSPSLLATKVAERAAEVAEEAAADTVGFITVKATKEADGSKVGLLFSQVGKGPPRIKAIREDSPFFGSALSAGQEIVNVNGTKVSTPKACSELLRAALAGEVSVSVIPMSLITGTVTKESKDSPCGIAFHRKGGFGPMNIKFIREDGLFAETPLVPKLNVISVAGVDVTHINPKSAAQLIRDAEAGPVSVCAQGSIITVEKDSVDAMTGISLQYTKATGVMRVTKISELGLFAKTPLQVGHQIVSINGAPCPNSASDAAYVINATEGTLTLIVCEYLSPEQKSQMQTVKSIRGSGWTKPLKPEAAPMATTPETTE